MSLNARDAVIIDYARTPMGRSRGGCFRHRRADDLSADLILALLKRNPEVDPASIDDFLWGCVLQREEQAFNIARNILLLANLPHTIPAQTINRLCGSSMTALHSATAHIRAGLGNTYLIGGVEHMGHIDMYDGIDPNPLMGLSVAKAANSMGLTAEYLAVRHKIGRERMDEFSYHSHQKAMNATNDGTFSHEIVPILGHDAAGSPCTITEDETIRGDTSLQALSELKPVFNPEQGLVTAGSSSQISDGASAMLLMAAETAQALGLKPIAKITSLGLSGVDPSIMGIGPVPATKKALAKAGMKLDDIDLIELNEAFGVQALAVLKEMSLFDGEKVDPKVNPYGGAIALGHPFGCSGTRIAGTLLTGMHKKSAKVGLATMCIGLGQGVSTIIESI